MAEKTKKATTKKTSSKKTVAKKSVKKATTKKVEPKVEVKETKIVEPKVEVKETKIVEPKMEVKETKIKKTPKKSFGDIVKENYTMLGLILVAILLIANIAIVTIGHKAKIKDGEEIIASVTNKEFSADTLFQELKNSNGMNTLITMVDKYIMKKEITDDEKVEAKKTAQENIDSIKSQYESAGYNWEDVLKQYGYENEEKLLDELMLSSEKDIVVKNTIAKSLSKDEIEKYYNENVFDKYTAKHILITPDTTDEMSDEEKAAKEEEALNQAKAIIEQLNNGSNFDDLVAEYSEDTGSKENNGLIENFTKGNVVDEFFDATAALKDGEYTTEPVKSTYGYHIIYRVSMTAKKELKDQKDELVEEIAENKLSEDANLYNNTLVDIRKKYKLTINDTTIKNAYEKSISE